MTGDAAAVQAGASSRGHVVAIALPALAIWVTFILLGAAGPFAYLVLSPSSTVGRLWKTTTAASCLTSAVACALWLHLCWILVVTGSHQQVLVLNAQGAEHASILLLNSVQDVAFHLVTAHYARHWTIQALSWTVLDVLAGVMVATLLLRVVAVALLFAHLQAPAAITMGVANLLSALAFTLYVIGFFKALQVFLATFPNERTPSSIASGRRSAITSLVYPSIRSHEQVSGPMRTAAPLQPVRKRKVPPPLDVAGLSHMTHSGIQIVVDDSTEDIDVAHQAPIASTQLPTPSIPMRTRTARPRARLRPLETHYPPLTPILMSAHSATGRGTTTGAAASTDGGLHDPLPSSSFAAMQMRTPLASSGQTPRLGHGQGHASASSSSRWAYGQDEVHASTPASPRRHVQIEIEIQEDDEGRGGDAYDDGEDESEDEEEDEDDREVDGYDVDESLGPRNEARRSVRRRRRPDQNVGTGLSPLSARVPPPPPPPLETVRSSHHATYPPTNPPSASRRSHASMPRTPHSYAASLIERTRAFLAGGGGGGTPRGGAGNPRSRSRSLSLARSFPHSPRHSTTPRSAASSTHLRRRDPRRSTSLCWIGVGCAGCAVLCLGVGVVSFVGGGRWVGDGDGEGLRWGPVVAIMTLLAAVQAFGTTLLISTHRDAPISSLPLQWRPRPSEEADVSSTPSSDSEGEAEDEAEGEGMTVRREPGPDAAEQRQRSPSAPVVMMTAEAQTTPATATATATSPASTYHTPGRPDHRHRRRHSVSEPVSESASPSASASARQAEASQQRAPSPRSRCASSPCNVTAQLGPP